MLARAFRDNPLSQAVIGPRDAARRLRCNTHGMRALLPVAERHGVALAARRKGRIAGVLVATPPFGYPLPPPPLPARLRCLAGQGWRVSQRWAQVFDAVSALHPPEPHAYLGLLGVDPALQGQGLGATLLGRWLEQSGPRSHPAYLETDRPENVRFYARAGFAVEGEITLFDVRVWRMRRPAQA